MWIIKSQMYIIKIQLVYYQNYWFKSNRNKKNENSNFLECILHSDFYYMVFANSIRPELCCAAVLSIYVLLMAMAVWLLLIYDTSKNT